MKKQKCKYCSKTFAKNSNSQCYCDNKCRNKYYYNKYKVVKPFINARCIKCRKMYTKIHGHNKYCSNECRFWSKVEIINDKCWKWRAAKNRKNGYGIFSIIENDKCHPVSAHRYSYIIHKGSIPRNMFVLHRCDNPECTNPNHLFCGTAQNNMEDKIMKGRAKYAYGENMGHNKLTEKQVLEIIKSVKKYDKNNSMTKIASRYNVSIATISLIMSGINWKHVK